MDMGIIYPGLFEDTALLQNSGAAATSGRALPFIHYKFY